jgi:methanogenic corrinoid protein MtbC1
MSSGDLIARMQAAVREGDDDAARKLADEGIRAGLDPIVILERGCTDTLRAVGDLWARGDIFLPEMMLSAAAVKAALETLKPRLLQTAKDAPAGIVVLGTVRGDIHDIGKNIVGTLLEAFGFRVVDLGTDVPAARFVGAVRESGARLVGLSALLTSTMLEMRAILQEFEVAGLRSGVRVAIGGAPVTAAFTRDIGADGFAEDGVAALHLFQRLASGEIAGDGPAAPAPGGGAAHAV